MAIERPDGQVVEALLEAGLTVVVISPNQLKNLRGRYGSAGNKDDRFDAFVLADTLRTDRARLRPLLPDSPATVTLRAAVPARKDLVGHRVALCNQLRAHLQGRLPRRGRPVPRARRPDQPGVPGPVRLPGPRGLADPQTAGRLAGKPGLLRPQGPRRTARPPDRRAPRRHRRRRRRQGARHPRPARRPGQPRRADQRPADPDRRAARPARRRAHLHLAAQAPGPSAPPGCSPRSATAGPGSPPPKR